jgi:hypothetical protein
MYDLIGDLHGHAAPLRSLLRSMDYAQTHGCYRHSDRLAVFVGDFIDRGPEIREVLEIVRTMVEQGTALAIMGNHEFNAMAFEAGYRPDTAKNRGHYQATLEQLRVPERLRWVEWFRTLPLWLDLGSLRVVHACWNTAAMAVLAEGLRQHGGFSDAFLQAAATSGGPLYEAAEIVLKGPEIALPGGVTDTDAEGNVRSHARTRWYLPPAGQSWRSYVFCRKELPDIPLAVPEGCAMEPYPDIAPPVFFGHYWFNAPEPALVAANVACLDYSVARNGFLCAYRWSGETRLDPANFRTAK